MQRSNPDNKQLPYKQLKELMKHIEDNPDYYAEIFNDKQFFYNYEVEPMGQTDVIDINPLLMCSTHLKGYYS